MTNTILSPKQLKFLSNQITDSRDHALITLVLETGCYVEEIINIENSDIDHSKKTILFKGKRERTITLSTTTHEILKTWILNRPATKLPQIFITHKHPYRPLTTRGVDALLRKWGEKSKLPVLNFQILRRTSKLETPIEKIDTSIKKAAEEPEEKNTVLYIFLFAFTLLYKLIKLIYRRN
jgi:integrase